MVVCDWSSDVALPILINGRNGSRQQTAQSVFGAFFFGESFALIGEGTAKEGGAGLVTAIRHGKFLLENAENTVLERIPRRTRDTVQRCILSAAGPKNFDIPKGWY